MDLYVFMGMLMYWEVFWLCTFFPRGAAPSPQRCCRWREEWCPQVSEDWAQLAWAEQVWSAAGKNTMLSWGICSVLAHPAWHSRVIRVTSLSCCRCVPGCSAAVTPKTGVRLGVGCSEDLKSSPSSRFLATAPFWYKSQGHKAKNWLLSSLLSVIYTFTSLLQIQTQCHVALEKD